MEKMYQDYKEIAEFRMVYIHEAHAADGDRPGRIGKQKGINDHKNLEDRCATAEMLMEDKSLTIPMLIDGMDNAVNTAYSAHPDRVFLVRKDGTLAVAAARGPSGFNPALKEVAAWLEEYAKAGKEPEIDSTSALDSDNARKNTDKK